MKAKMSLQVVILCFLAGLFQDGLTTLYTRWVAEKKILSASLMSVLITITGYLLFASMLSSMLGGNYTYLTAYAIGGGLGTYGALYKRTHDI